MNKSKLIRKFDKQADMYERNRSNHALQQWRSKLLRSAEGQVLEVAVGVGANFPYYNKENVSLTAVDFSPEMLKKAKAFATACGMKALFIQSDIETLDFKANSFDTIVSTLSLCSYVDPVQMLRQFRKWCRPGGSILLMEHGLSSNPLLAVLQKATAPIAYRFSGCHYDRNMMKIIHEAGLSIEHAEHYWSRTIHLVWASPD